MGAYLRTPSAGSWIWTSRSARRQQYYIRNNNNNKHNDDNNNDDNNNDDNHNIDDDDDDDDDLEIRQAGLGVHTCISQPILEDSYLEADI